MSRETVVMQPEVAENERASLKGFRFFMPSTELTNAIMEENQRLVSDYVETNFPPEHQISEIDSQTEDGSRLESERPRFPSTVDPERQTVIGKRLISERLYHYLSSLAESPWARAGHDFPIAEYIPDGMATMLGLSAHRDMPRDSERAMEISQMLEEVTQEFRNWLLEEEHGSFVTPWIKIDLSDNALRLTLIEESEDSSQSTEATVADGWAFAEIAGGADPSEDIEAISMANDDQSVTASST